MHPRNRHAGRYDFAPLTQASPELSAFVISNPDGERTVDFADPAAVEALNRALLKHWYGLSRWAIPPGYLCPPIPGRADYVHHVADLLASCNKGAVPAGAAVRVLDVGVGANCIYPIIGRCEYGWSFVGTEIDAAALAAAKAIVDANAKLSGGVELRRQASAADVFKGVLKSGETFDLSICNPPFHASLEQAQGGTFRKRTNLGLQPSTERNFGGQGGEIWCAGGEAGFVSRMISESARIPEKCLWFTTLISKAENLPGVEKALDAAKADEVFSIEMEQGRKKSRIVAWTFFDQKAREAWRARRWKPRS